MPYGLKPFVKATGRAASAVAKAACDSVPAVNAAVIAASHWSATTWAAAAAASAVSMVAAMPAAVASSAA